MKIQLSDPVVVIQSKEVQSPWGVLQFATINRLGPDKLQVTFNQSPDAYLESASDYSPVGEYRSADGGKTWYCANRGRRYGGHEEWVFYKGKSMYLQFPYRQNIPKSELPEPVDDKCSDGYGGFYAIFDPLQIPKGMGQGLLMTYVPESDEWHSAPVTIDDPNRTVTGHDPTVQPYFVEQRAISDDKAHAVKKDVIQSQPHYVMSWEFCLQLLELPDGSLLASFTGDRLGPDRKRIPKNEPWCMRSTDGGLTWKFHGIIARDEDNSTLLGYGEQGLAVLPDGSLLAALRTEMRVPGAMFQTRSADGGRTWSTPRQIHPFGVRPNILTLASGVVVLSFGRPGAHLMFSPDGTGNSWQNRITLVAESFEGTGMDAQEYGYRKEELPEGKPKLTRTSGYTSLVATGPDSFLVVYDQFDYPNEKGEPRKAILARKVTVSR